MDYEMTRKVWESQVAIQFIKENEDCVPFYTMMPRYSYFPLTIPKVLSYFKNLTNDENLSYDKVWLESDGVPLKMHLPIGVLCDHHSPNPDSTWDITIRFTSQPTGYISIDRNMMESIFIQTIKEADYLKQKAEVTNQMKKEEYKKLWNSIVNNYYDDFQRINQKLMDTSKKNFEYIPLRVYVQNQSFKQVLVNFQEDSGALKTIGTAISETLKESIEDKKLISYGIEIPVETPLIYAAKNLAYPDNFIHILLI